MDSRRIVRYPDTHQLFVGNLPHDIDESELKDFFMSTFLRGKKKNHFVDTFSVSSNHPVTSKAVFFPV